MSHYGSPPDPPEGRPEQPGPGDQQAPTPPSDPYAQPSPYAEPSPYAQQSPYGQADPYGQAQNPYGQQQNPYAQPGQQPPAAPGANPYGGGRPDKPTFGFGGYAGWFTRVGAYLIDAFLGNIVALPLWIGYIHLFTTATTTTRPDGTKDIHFHSGGGTLALIWLGILTGLAFNIWNVYIRQGRYGATYGKSVLAIRLVNADLQPIGIGWAFLRNLLHVVDSLACFVGWLWPIWDSRKQTFADKIMSTFVIQATNPQPPAYPPQPQPYQPY
jgi:uncharacterized RDD family membrane protein YckC